MSFLVIAATALVMVGLHGVLTLAHPVRRVLAANILGSGVFLLLLSLSRGPSGQTDPVPQAMVLTGIVVSFAATALVLALVRSLDSDGEADPEKE